MPIIVSQFQINKFKKWIITLSRLKKSDYLKEFIFRIKKSAILGIKLWLNPKNFYNWIKYFFSFNFRFYWNIEN